VAGIHVVVYGNVTWCTVLLCMVKCSGVRRIPGRGESEEHKVMERGGVVWDELEGV
jgi:hypothetical protein